MDGSRRRVIAKAKIINAFIATEDCWGGGGDEPWYTNAQLRNIHWKGKFLEGKSRRIFEFKKPA